MHLISLVLVAFVAVIQAQIFAPFKTEGIFTGCWSTTGTLATSTYISIGPVTPPAPGATLPSTGVLMLLPDDPNPTVINQDPNSLLIQMGAFQQLSRNELCNGFNAPPFPGTVAVPALGQKAFSGFYGSAIVIDGLELLLPECIPPGIPGVICNPALGQRIISAIHVIITENLIGGFITAPTDPRADFDVNTISCVPIIYNNPITGFTLTAVVLDQFGFNVDPKTIPVQGGVVSEGWFSQVPGETNLFYYFSTLVTAGTILPNQLVGVVVVKCVEPSFVFNMRGGVRTGFVGATVLDWGTVTVTDTLTGTVILTDIPKDSGLVEQSASWLVRAKLNVCPRSVTVTWNIPVGLVVGPGPNFLTVQDIIL